MSESKTAKIVEVLGVREWTGQYGTNYSIKLLLDNDSVGDVNKKKPDAFKAGDEFHYTEEKTEYGTKFKEIKDTPFTGGKSGGKSFSDPKTMLLAYAKDVEVALISYGSYGTIGNVPSNDEIVQAILDRADKFLAWYNGGQVDSTLTPRVNVAPEETDTEFSGGQMRAVPAVQYETPKQAPQQQEGVREKPNKGTGGKAPSQAQTNLLKKLALERNVDLDAWVRKEWDDVQYANEISSWATSWCIDVLMNQPR